MRSTKSFRRPRSARYRRKTAFRELRQSFLIVCEGEKTEPNYFRKFRVPEIVVDVRGIGHNTLSLVKKAVDMRERGRNEGTPYDQVWCVFDRNSFPADSFNSALELAQRENIRVAYSNEAFELWYLLHFHYYHSATSRRDYVVKLGQLLGQYEKNSDSMYDRLLDRQTEAIRNAQRLLSRYDPVNPVSDNPSTTVHLLVEELNKNAEPFRT